MLKPIFRKKVQGQKHPGSWEIAEHQIASIKVLFKTNIKGHKHLSSRLFIRELDTIGKPKKNKKVTFNPEKPHTSQKYIPIECDGAQFRQHRMTLQLFVYIRPITKLIYRMHIYILTQSFWTGTMVTRRKHIINWDTYSLFIVAKCRIYASVNQGMEALWLATAYRVPSGVAYNFYRKIYSDIIPLLRPHLLTSSVWVNEIICAIYTPLIFVPYS